MHGANNLEWYHSKNELVFFLNLVKVFLISLFDLYYGKKIICIKSCIK